MLNIRQEEEKDYRLEDMEPDILLMDIYLPDRDGMEVVSEIRRRETLNRLQVVFLTISPDHALMAYDLDARQYLVKPVKKERLFKALDQILDSRRGEGQESLVVRERGGGVSRIAVSRILYCETQGNYQIITTEDEEIATHGVHLYLLVYLIGHGLVLDLGTHAGPSTIGRTTIGLVHRLYQS